MQHLSPQKKVTFVGKAPKQQGYVLLIAMMLLVMLAAPFFYQATLQSTNQMQQALYERQENKLKALKQQIIVYAKYPGMACNTSDPSDPNNNIPDLQDSPVDGIRGVFVFKDEEGNDTGMLDSFSEFKADKAHIVFKFFDLDGDDKPIYAVKECGDYPNQTSDDNNACKASQNLLMQIYWKENPGQANPDQATNAQMPNVYLYQSDLDCN